MSRYRLEVRVTPRAGLLDPEGKAIHHALGNLGFDEVEDVRVGRVLLLDVDAESPDAARERADEMCRRLLANPVTEDYRVTSVDEAAGAAGGKGEGDGDPSGGA